MHFHLLVAVFLYHLLRNLFLQKFAGPPVWRLSPAPKNFTFLDMCVCLLFSKSDGSRVMCRDVSFKVVTVWALPRSTLVQVGIAHVQSSIYVAQPTSDSQFSAVLPLSSHRYKGVNVSRTSVSSVRRFEIIPSSCRGINSLSPHLSFSSLFQTQDLLLPKHTSRKSMTLCPRFFPKAVTTTGMCREEMR
jgi:hypothetical protein